MGKIALLLLDFFKVEANKQRVFVNLLDEHLNTDFSIITDSNIDLFTNNIEIIKIPRTGKENLKDILMNVSDLFSKFILFKNYEIENALWFLPYLHLDEKIIVVKKRGKLFERLANWLDSLLSFNSIGSLKQNMIIDANELKQLLLSNKDSLATLNRIRDSVLFSYEDEKEGLKQKVEEITNKLVDKRFWKYIGASSLSYAINSGTFLATSLSLPAMIAAAIASEAGTLTNFFANENLTFGRAYGIKSLATYN
jgi:hypothetical protein